MATLEAFYKRIDLEMADLYAHHGDRLNCRPGCADCCVDDITVFQVEADHIRHHHGDLLVSAAPHPTGACAFLDEHRGCRIYPHRPYVCRTQGPPLRWMDETAVGDIVEMRDICPLNDPGPAIETLPPEACWELGPAETILAGLQSAQYSGMRTRISLRQLFQKKADST